MSPRAAVSGRVADVLVRTAQEADLPRADAVLREAFDAFTGRVDHLGDADPLRSRWRTGPERVVVAELDDEVVGSNALTVRGTAGWFGPLSVAPRLWGCGLAHPLVDEAGRRLDAAGAVRSGLFTFADSALHQSLYARHGYRSGAPMLVLSREARPAPAAVPATYGDLTAQDRAALLRELAVLTDGVEPGWDLRDEVVSTWQAGLGDTVVLEDHAGVAGAAVFQVGAGSDARSGTCRVKVAVVRSGPGSDARMSRLLDAVDAEALRRGARAVVVTVSTASEGCARLVLARGCTVSTRGVAMHRGGPGHLREDAWVLDDWR